MTKEREIPECRKAFEKHFSNLDLSSICGKAYTSKITNRTWRGFEAAWNMRDVNPDASRPLPASDNAGELERVRDELRTLSGFCPEHFSESPDCQMDCALFVKDNLSTLFELLTAAIANADKGAR